MRNSVLLESALPDSENDQNFLFRDPVEIVTAYQVEDVVSSFKTIDRWVKRGYYAAGYVAYEAGFAFEDVALSDVSDTPLLWFGIFKAPSEITMWDGATERSETTINPTFSLSKPEYGRCFDQIKQHLLEGDVYQVNLTGNLQFDYEGTPKELYRLLRDRQRAGYNALIDTGDRAIISCSPELFFRRDGSEIWTRPMKGTIRRGATVVEDAVLTRHLKSDPKTRAENLMIVDLLRNDLARVTQPGSVKVPALFETEEYETVIQMTSTVSGRLQKDVSYLEIFAALFPCGSVTGAPKISAMKVIEEIEHRVRGVYTGAIGYIAPDDRAVFSVAIRTIILSEGVGNMGTGGGIVWDSTKDAEYRECQLKASFLTGLPVGPDLIETVAWRRDDGFRLLDRNVARIRASAGELGYPFDESIFRSRLKELVAEFSAPRYRVRILLHADGELSVSSTPLKGGSVLPGSVSISDIRTDPDDVWLRHKTTQREIYDAEYARAQEEGHTEVLFLNRHGQVTEGSRTNIFVMKDEVLSTPPLSCGLLPGTRRAEVLEMRGDAVERPLFLADLVAADVIYLCNATTRLTPVSLEID